MSAIKSDEVAYYGFNQIPGTDLISFSNYKCDSKDNKYDVVYFGFVNVTKSPTTVELLHPLNQISWTDDTMANRISQIFICTMHISLIEKDKYSIVLGLRKEFEAKIQPKDKTLRLSHNGEEIELGIINDVLKLEVDRAFELPREGYCEFRNYCVETLLKSRK